MTNQHDDARLTAYALGELSDKDRAKVEARLETDPAARQTVEEIRQLAGLLGDHLAAEAAPELNGKRRRTIEARAARRPRRRALRPWLPLTAAAALLLGFGLGLLAAYWGPGAEPAMQRLVMSDSSESMESKKRTSPSDPPSPTGTTVMHRREYETRHEHPSIDEATVMKELQATLREGVDSGPKLKGGKLGKAGGRAPVSTNRPRPAPTVAAPGKRTPPEELSKAKVDEYVAMALRGGTLGKAGDKRLRELAKQKRRQAGNEPQGWGDQAGWVAGNPYLYIDFEDYPGSPDVDSAETREDAGWKYRAPGSYGDWGRYNREGYDRIVDNAFRTVAKHPLSTFSIDVDTASYSNVRRMLLTDRRLPPKGAVRIEEMINYFPYGYAGPEPADAHPFAVHAAVARCPWQARHRLVRVAIKGREIPPDKRPGTNLVFLLDVSGSMRPANKLPLVKSSMKMLVDRLGEDDHVAIVVYAGEAGLALDSTSCDDKKKVLAAVDGLKAGGSTAGGAGIKLAYDIAVKNFIRGGVNRVILCTDGDFNVGVTSDSELVRLIEAKAKTGVFLTVLGFGMGNYQDSRLEKLADKGNGNYGYVDTEAEANKLLVEQLSGTLVTIAKDVKIQIEFNPARVAGYRLIGYENRILAKEDFNDDTKDAGEIGAGHTVTALYEIVPAGKKVAVASVDPLKYQTPAKNTAAADSKELLTLKLRYKKPDGDKSTLMQYPVRDRDADIGAAGEDFRFAAAVASFGMILRDSKYKGAYTLDAAIELADSAKGKDSGGYRAEFVKLVRAAKGLKRR